MLIGLVTVQEWNLLMDYLASKENELNVLQTAIADLTAKFSALSSAATAAQAKQYTDADVANLNALGGQVDTLAASFTPAPAPVAPATPVAPVTPVVPSTPDVPVAPVAPVAPAPSTPDPPTPPAPAAPTS